MSALGDVRGVELARMGPVVRAAQAYVRVVARDGVPRATERAALRVLAEAVAAYELSR